METEVKYLVQQGLDQLEERVKQLYPQIQFIQELDLPAIYYDTPMGVLEKKRSALRVRKEEGEWIGCYKSATDVDKVFIEEEIPVQDKEIKERWYQRLTHYPEIKKVIGAEELQPVVDIYTLRRVYLLKRDHLSLEIVFDRVTYQQGKAFEERMEVELIEGDLRGFEKFLATFVTQMDDLEETKVSKYMRGREVLLFG